MSSPSASERKKSARATGKKKGKRYVRVIKRFLAGVTLIVLVAFIAGFVVWNRATQEAEAKFPTVEKQLSSYRVPPSQILDRNGVVLYQVSNEFRQPITNLSEVPKFVRDAVVAAEDRRFYKTEGGVDITALGRVMVSAAESGKLGQGGSTLTMQLAKRLSSNGKKTLTRKLSDMAMATVMDEHWDKDSILKLYLNQVFFGSGAYGIKAASIVYFDKPVEKLTLAEAALLARCVRRPSDENPFKNPDKALANRHVVLNIMLQEQMISQEEYDKADKEKLHLRPHHHDVNGNPERAPYFVQHVLSDMGAVAPDVHLGDGGYTIKTTLDYGLQKATEQAVREVLADHHGEHVNTAAFVLMNGDGEIIAEVGGVDYSKNQFNIITRGSRQPGSSFKPIVYATALKFGKLTADSSISNERLTYVDPTSHVPWSPQNDNGRYGGRVSVYRALAESINVPAARTILDVGVDNVVSIAHQAFGIKSNLREFPSLALGASEVSPLEMAQAYSVFMLRGNRATPYTINEITDQDGNVIASNSPKIVRDVLDSKVCEDVDGLLKGPVSAGGTGWKAAVIPDARGKTGTTSVNKDAWFCGFADGMVGVGWVGNQHYDAANKQYVMNSMGKHVFGGTVTVEIWTKVFQQAIKKYSANYAQRFQKNVNGDAQLTPPPPAQTEVATAKPDPAITPPADPASAAAATTTPDPTQADGGNSVTISDSGGVDTAGAGANVPTPPSNPPAPDPTTATATVKATKVKQKPKAQEYVTVDVCADSGELATDYCPEVISRTYKKGLQPTRHCHIHKG